MLDVLARDAEGDYYNIEIQVRRYGAWRGAKNSTLQLNLLELKKADRLDVAPSPLRDWVTFFRYWHEEATMADIRHEPVQEALEHVRILSANDRERRLAFVRERALRDEVSFLKEARQEGRQEGQHQGIEGTLRKQIALKFGELPVWADDRLTQASDAQLDIWVMRILTAESLEGLLAD